MHFLIQYFQRFIPKNHYLLLVPHMKGGEILIKIDSFGNNEKNAFFNLIFIRFILKKVYVKSNKLISLIKHQRPPT